MSSSAAGHAASQPPVVVCVGMAGSGKTTFMQRINAHLHQRHRESPSTTAPPYVVNLDPAVHSVPFESNIDIRDSVNYKEVMKQYNLGPNGGILTSLNLFSTKVDQVMGILEKRCLPQAETASDPLPAHILIDTPGQIEVFVWSASGSILLGALASSFPTVIAYVVDTPRCAANTSTFMSNMLYAISILYKTRLPMVLVFNKTDVQSEEEPVSWMRDFEAFQEALRKDEEAEQAGAGNGRSGYMGSLLNSMSLVLEEFYNTLAVVGVSSVLGTGIDAFFDAVKEKAAEFERDYKPEMVRRKENSDAQKTSARDADVARMMRDMNVTSSTGRSVTRPAVDDEPETVSDAEDAAIEAEKDAASGIVDRDEDESDEDLHENGLTDRYENALRNRGGVNAARPAASYIRTSQR